MRSILLAVSAAIFLLPVSAHASRHDSSGPVQQFCDTRYCGSAPVSEVQTARRQKGHQSRHRTAKGAVWVARSGARDGCRSGVGALSCVTPQLGAKAREIVDACGSEVVSAIAGRPNRSNHPAGKAVDLKGNPSCIYAHLHGWPGGYSTDYGRVNHVHISYNPGGQEWGVRFVHGGHRHSRTRYAGAQSLIQHATALPPQHW